MEGKNKAGLLNQRKEETIKYEESSTKMKSNEFMFSTIEFFKKLNFLPS